MVPDQLRISEGWVRCGQCEEVFDGNANLQPEDALQNIEVAATGLPESEQPPPLPPLPQQPQQPPASNLTVSEVDAYDWGDAVDQSVTASEVAPTNSSQAAGFRDELLRTSGNATEPPIPPTHISEPEPVFVPEVDPVLEAKPAQAVEPLLQDEQAAALSSMTTTPSEEFNISPLGTMSDFDTSEPADNLRYVQADAPLPAPVQNPRPSFMAQKPVRKSSRAERAGMFSLCLVLVFLLAGQVLLRERDRLAAIQPPLKPLLQALCDGLGCQVAPLRQIETLVIESSSFTKVRGDIYRLGFAIKNPAAVDLALPAMELTLTDSQERVLLKKVLQTPDFARADSLAAGADFVASIAVQVKLGSQNERVTGYRLLAFYP